MQTISFTQFEKFLKADGWSKVYDMDRRSKYNERIVIYEKQLADRLLDLQLWGDGEHRLSFYQNGGQCTRPTCFCTLEEMHAAIKFESERSDGYKR